MNITINGDVYITNYGQTLDELVGESLPAYQFEDDCDCDIEEYEMDCDECDFCDECDDCDFEDDNETDIDEIVDELTSIYAEILSEDCVCPECVKDILIDLIKDFVGAL